MSEVVTTKIGRPGKLMLGTLSAGVLTVAAMGSGPTANATCVSFFGLNSGGQCTSTLSSIAVAIGENAEAHADGLLGAAITLGTSSSAATVAGAVLNLAVTLGDNNLTIAGGIGSVAAVANSINQTVLAGEGALGSGNAGNVAVSLASPEATETIANGIGNFAANVAGSGNVYARGFALTTVNLVGLGATLDNGGTFNNITNILGNNNFISNLDGQGGIANVTFNVVGSDNDVRSSGALAVAGAFGSVGQTVVQTGPGVNVSFLRQTAMPGSARVAPSAAVKDDAGADAGSDTTSVRAKAGTPRTRASRSG